MDNYIGKIEAEWVDPAVELPDKSDYYKCRNCMGAEFVTWYSESIRRWDANVVAWLRIGGPSDAVPRAQVQAAVDEIEDQENLASIYGEDHMHGLTMALDAIHKHTGITPTVTP